MAWTSPLRILVSDAIDTSGDWLRIEQPEWEKPSISGFTQWLDATGKKRTMYNIFDLMDEYQSFCNKDGELEVEIEVHRSRPDLAYTIFAHHGVLSEKPFRHTKAHTKIVPIMMKESFDLDVMATTGAATWEGQVVNALGEAIAHPPIAFSGKSFSWPEPVIGSLRIHYKESHDAFILTIPSRKNGEFDPEKTETAYETSVVAQWPGGVEVHDVDIPDSSGTCRGGASVSVKDKDDDDGEKEKCIELEITLDPCDETKELSRERHQIPCPGEAGDG